MKKYIVLSLICFSFSALAAKDSAVLGQLGEDNASDSKNNCNRKEIQGCGPCFKLCMEQNSGDRSGKEVANGSIKAKSKSGTVGKQ